jgi:hypothetical protein
MDTLQSWVLVASLVLGVGYTTLQAYRLAQWKENNH